MILSAAPSALLGGRPQPRRVPARRLNRPTCAHSGEERGPAETKQIEQRRNEAVETASRPNVKPDGPGLFSAISTLGLGDELRRQELTSWALLAVLSSAHLTAACNLSAYLEGAQAPVQTIKVAANAEGRDVADSGERRKRACWSSVRASGRVECGF